MASNNEARTIERILAEVDGEMRLNDEVFVKKQIDYIASYFSRISNSDELFRFGKDIALNLKKGIKHIAITSPGLKNSQQKAILGICCFFGHFEHLKIAIISDQIKAGVFQDLMASSKSMSYPMEAPVYNMDYNSFQNRIDFIDYAVLLKSSEAFFYNESFDKELAIVFERYDLILWDVPELEKIKLNPHFNYRMSIYYQTLAIIIFNQSSIKKIEELRDHFKGYKLNFSKVLFDTSFDDSKKNNEKSFWGMFKWKK
jgi:hypothetical protein